MNRIFRIVFSDQVIDAYAEKIIRGLESFCEISSAETGIEITFQEITPPRFAMLTKREREILKLLAEGGTAKEIACDLNLSIKTIESHKFNLMRKLDIHNKTQLIHYALRKGIIKIPAMA